MKPFDCNFVHSGDVFIIIIMLLLWASPTARCNLLHENYHNNTDLQKGGEEEAHANGTAMKEDRRPNQAVITHRIITTESH